MALRQATPWRSFTSKCPNKNGCSAVKQRNVRALLEWSILFEFSVLWPGCSFLTGKSLHNCTHKLFSSCDRFALGPRLTVTAWNTRGCNGSLVLTLKSVTSGLNTNSLLHTLSSQIVTKVQSNGSKHGSKCWEWGNPQERQTACSPGLSFSLEEVGRQKPKTERLSQSDGNNIMKWTGRPAGPPQEGEEEASGKKWHLNWDLKDKEEPRGQSAPGRGSTQPPKGNRPARRGTGGPCGWSPGREEGREAKLAGVPVAAHSLRRLPWGGGSLSPSLESRLASDVFDHRNDAEQILHLDFKMTGTSVSSSVSLSWHVRRLTACGKDPVEWPWEHMKRTAPSWAQPSTVVSAKALGEWVKSSGTSLAVSRMPLSDSRRLRTKQSHLAEPCPEAWHTKA